MSFTKTFMKAKLNPLMLLERTLLKLRLPVSLIFLTSFQPKKAAESKC